jgi:peptide/nickel transport system substrate-binding protein
MTGWGAKAALLCAALIPLPGQAAGQALIETPMLEPQVKQGVLPPVAERLPVSPAIAEATWPGWRPGKQGGDLNILMSRPKDVRLMVVYGYARLVAYSPDYRLKADILEKYSVENGRRFTFYLRPGHRWSDGAPFTADDFRYFWEDIANNPAVSPLGPPSALLVDGEAPVFEVLGEYTIRYSWTQPNPDFLAALAAARPLYIYRPAHYLKRFHHRYTAPRELRKRVRKSGRRNWAALHNRRDNQYRNDNPELPTLQPWIARTRLPAQRFIFDRNPYYHRIDAAGRQLPYLDRVIMNIAAPGIIPGKTGSGESDLQGRYIQFRDYTFLKQAEKRNGYKVRLWRTAKGSHFTLFPNMNARDPVWRKLFRDVRFRRALSLAVDRHEINQVIYFGLTREGNNTVLRESPLFRPKLLTAWAYFDLKTANALLDDIGLTKRNGDGRRLLPDGRPMEIVVETSGEDTQQTDLLQLIHDSWLTIGIKIHTRPSQREVFRNRIFAGETLISVWSGYENGLPTPDMSPAELAPTSQQQLQWPQWGQYFQSGGRVGEAPALPAAQELLSLYKGWRRATTTAARKDIWQRMLTINADRVFTIGVISSVPQPIIIAKNLRNVPEKGIYNWNPGAHFGVYRPDSFWLEGEQQSKK